MRHRPKLSPVQNPYASERQVLMAEDQLTIASFGRRHATRRGCVLLMFSVLILQCRVFALLAV